MALEAGNFISDLVVTNPPGTDDKRQGDDHIRLIKSVLKNTFPGATKAFPIPTSTTKTGDYVVTGNDQNSLILVNNSAASTLTMPVLGTVDAGWSLSVIKLNTAFPLFIAPPSGSIVSGQAVVAKVRRQIPNIPFTVFWTGSNWVVERVATAPIGSIIPFFTAALPVGYEWPNGQTLAAANYPEYVVLRGDATTPDLRQRTVFGTDLGGVDTGRITSVIGPTLGNSGGNQFMQQHNHSGSTTVEQQSFNHNFGGTTGINNESIDHTHGFSDNFFAAQHQAPPGGGSFAGTNSTTPNSTGTSSIGHGSHTHSFSGVTGTQNQNHTHLINLDGAGGSQNMPPTIICNYALVVE